MAPKGSKNALKHGGEAAVKAISAGEPLAGMALTVQDEVHTDYQQGGASAMVLEQAERLTAASRLYWEAVLAACKAGNIFQVDGFMARYGWLAGASVRAWAEVKKQDGRKGDKAAKILEAINE